MLVWSLPTHGSHMESRGLFPNQSLFEDSVIAERCPLSLSEVKPGSLELGKTF